MRREGGRHRPDGSGGAGALNAAWRYVRATWPLLAMIALFAGVLCVTAWVCDDAYITLRTVDNLVHGLGMTWNPAERVQVFTHPLWFLLLAAVYFFTREAFYTTIFLSLAVSLLAFVLLALKSRPRPALYVGLLILIMSKAFVDYSTSGLENPLTNLLLVGCSLLVLGGGRDAEGADRRLLAVSVVCGLCALNRLDTILLFVPLLLWRCRQRPGWSTIGTMVLGFAPLLLWELFSIVYYGFPFPNTAYAKLNAAIPAGQLVQQGFAYFGNALRRDPLTMVTIAAGIWAAFTSRKPAATALAAGIVLYLGYVIRIGGDFMGGRFFGAPMVLAVAVLVWRCEGLKRRPAFALAGLVVVLGFLSSTPSVVLQRGRPDLKKWTDQHEIADERMIYFPVAGLLRARPGQIQPRHPWAVAGLMAGRSGDRLMTATNIGFRGYFAGPGVHILDTFALADPLLARIPFRGTKWRVGHLERAIPAGYKETILSGENRIQDPALASFYAQLRPVITGPLFTAERWRAIWRLNTGQDDHLIAAYLRS